MISVFCFKFFKIFKLSILWKKLFYFFLNSLFLEPKAHNLNLTFILALNLLKCWRKNDNQWCELSFFRSKLKFLSDKVISIIFYIV